LIRGVVSQLGSLVQGLVRLLSGGKPLPTSAPDGHANLEDRQLGATFLQVAAAGTALLDRFVSLPGAASSTGRPLNPHTAKALRSLAFVAERTVLLAHSTGQAAAAAEAERLAGRALKLALEAGSDPRLLADGWMSLTCMLRLPGSACIELVGTGAVDAAVAWLKDWRPSTTEDWQPVSSSTWQTVGVAAASAAGVCRGCPPRPVWD
jgi:hypothetical protein